MLPGAHLGKRLRRHHIHFAVADVGAPRAAEGETEDVIGELARKEFARGGHYVYEGPGFDIDIDYDGMTYTVTAWVY